MTSDLMSMMTSDQSSSQGTKSGLDDVLATSPHSLHKGHEKLFL